MLEGQSFRRTHCLKVRACEPNAPQACLFGNVLGCCERISSLVASNCRFHFRALALTAHFLWKVRCGAVLLATLLLPVPSVCFITEYTQTQQFSARNVKMCGT